MRIQTFLALLITLLVALSVTFASFFYDEKKIEIPVSACISNIKNASFINDAYQGYSFQGKISFWPKNNSVSAFGILTIDDEHFKLRRNIDIEKGSYRENSYSGVVKTVNLSPSDNVTTLGKMLFSHEGEKIVMDFEKISDNRYVVFVNDNWVSMCEIRK
jgi:hypothetical protein